MNKFSPLLLLLFLTISISTLNAQNSEIDSLQNLLSNHQKEDTTKVNLLIEISHLYDIHDKKVLKNSQKAFELADKLNYNNGKINSLLEIGDYYYSKSAYKKSIEYPKKALKIARKLDNKIQIATCLNHIGVVYDIEGNYIQAIASFQESLKINEDLGDKEGISTALLNIGNIYAEQNDYKKALEYYEKSFEIDENLGNEYEMVASLINIAGIYEETNKYDKALEYAEKGLKIANQIQDGESIAYSLDAIASIYYKKGNYNKALPYLEKALILHKSLDDKYGVSGVYENFSNVFLEKKEYKKALIYAKKSLEIGEYLQALEGKKTGHELLSQIYEATQNYKEAYQHYKKYKAFNDSTFNENNIKEITNLENKYQYNKEKQAIALEQAKKDAIQEAEIKEQNKIRNLLILGILLTVLLVFIAVYGFLQKQKANKVLAEQKEEILSTNEELKITVETVNQQKEEILSTNEELNITLETVNQQKETIEKSHKKTQASINYASKIQAALLPSQKAFSAQLSEYFIFYKPKDIVSGDFYYLKKVNNFLIIAVADCTGHGVPGALVSMLGISFLNEILIKKEFSTAADILEELRKQVKNSLKQSEKNKQSKDGMDIALCVLDTQTNLMQFAGAYNPLYVVRDKALIEIKGTKNPIGVHLKEKSFENHQIQLENKDSIYLFSDGYIDQFGGEKGMKFMSKRFKQLVVEMAEKPFKEQSEILENTLQNWKNGHEQVDDIAILGFKI